jgi:hypothetical protein
MVRSATPRVAPPRHLAYSARFALRRSLSHERYAYGGLSCDHDKRSRVSRALTQLTCFDGRSPLRARSNEATSGTDSEAPSGHP